MRALIDIAIEPRRAEELAALRAALDTLQRDGSIVFKTDDESGQTIVSGTDELTLDNAIERLRVIVGEINVGVPQVAYRETITRKVELDYAHKRPAGWAAQFARIKFRVEPGKSGSGFRFVSMIAGGYLPDDYVAGVRKGVEAVMSAGPVIGFPMIDLAFTLLDGAYHEKDSSAGAFEIAGRLGFREAVEKAAPRILEPIMRIEVLTPEACIGDIIGDLNSRRGQITGMEGRGAAQVVHAMVPLAGMFGYVNSLRAMSGGQAWYTLTFDHYEVVPSNLDPDDRFPPAMAMRA